MNSYSQEKASNVENIDNIKVECFNVEPQTKDSVMVPLLRLKSQIPKDDKFLDNLEIDITDNIKNLNDSNSFRIYLKNNPKGMIRGTSCYSDEKLPNRIVIQEKAHKLYKLINCLQNGVYTDIPALKQTMMHEAGHLFDEYYGHDHNAEYALKWDSVIYAKEISPDENPYKFKLTLSGKQIADEYIMNNCLSDKEEFCNAILEDMNNLKYVKEEELPINIDYYAEESDINKIWNTEDIKEAEFIRSEVYADLFSYALKEDDGDREKFIKCFPKCYEVVKNDIIKFLKIEI